MNHIPTAAIEKIDIITLCDYYINIQYQHSTIMTSSNQFSFAEVCAGAGGLSKGFINKGFQPVFLNDFDKVCCRTLLTNHPTANIINGSMTDINMTQYKNIDVLMGGVPCQSFSQIGERKGLDDERGNLMMEFIRMIQISQPKVFLIENVKGLTTHDKGNTFKIIMEKLSEMHNYEIHSKILNANDYGVPQKRERLIIIGVNKDFISKEYEYPKKKEYKPVLRDVLFDVPQSDGYQYKGRKKEIMELVPQGGCWINLPEDIQREYLKNSFDSGGGKRGIARRLSYDEPSLTLTCSPCQKQTERCHPTETRPLTIREYARIQTFPDDYIFEGSIAQQYKQIGNAVPVKMAEKLAKSIKKILKN